MKPVNIRLIEKKKLLIRWDDDSVSHIALDKLRRLCPCATCVTEREKQSKTFIPIFMHSQISVDDIKTIGNYAISIVWKDGHNTGIYEYPYLQKLSEN